MNHELRELLPPFEYLWFGTLGVALVFCLLFNTLWLRRRLASKLKALYRSLSSQWPAQQEREAEIAALAHDLKTPLTLVGGNAELLLDEELPESSRKMVQTIVTSNN